MLIFCEQSEIFGDVDFLNRNKRRLCLDALQNYFCLVTERAIWFRIKLELNWKIHTLEFSTSRQKWHAFFT